MEETSVHCTMPRGLIRSVLASVPIHGARVGWGEGGREVGAAGQEEPGAGDVGGREGGEEIGKGLLFFRRKLVEHDTSLAEKHKWLTDIIPLRLTPRAAA